MGDAAVEVEVDDDVGVGVEVPVGFEGRVDYSAEGWSWESCGFVREIRSTVRDLFSVYPQHH